MTIQKTLFLIVILMGFGVGLTHLHAQPRENHAESILMEMSTYISGQKKINITFNSGIEVITPYLEKLEFNSSSTVFVNRPHQLYAHRISGHADVELRFDGEVATIYGKNVNGFLKIDAPGNLDQLIERLREGEGIALPGADLLLSDPYKVLTENTMESKYLGRGIIDGEQCDHLAFRNFDTDWQLWVRVGARPVPCKMVVTSKTISNAPQYTLHVTSWKEIDTIAPALFEFEPSSGSKQLSPEALIDFDELPTQTDN